jgi:hypothetical protein
MVLKVCLASETACDFSAVSQFKNVRSLELTRFARFAGKCSQTANQERYCEGNSSHERVLLRYCVTVAWLFDPGSFHSLS